MRQATDDWNKGPSIVNTASDGAIEGLREEGRAPSDRPTFGLTGLLPSTDLQAPQKILSEADRPAKETSYVAARRRYTAARTHRVAFLGSGGDYFTIWIRDFFLTVLTLGVYSAWAKVRRLQYFYRGTSLIRASFDYHADPVSILKGRALMVAVLIAGQTLRSFGGWPEHLVTLAYAFVFPWAYCQGLRFRSASTSYRNVSFGTSASLTHAYSTLLLPSVIVAVATDIASYVAERLFSDGPAMLITLAVFTLGIGYLQFATKRFFWECMELGNTSFETTLPLPDLLLTWIVAAIGFVVGLFLFVVVLQPRIPASSWIHWSLFLLISVFLKSYIESETRLRVAASLNIENAQFRCTMNVWRLFLIQTQNLVLTVLTAGLYWPWAAVRLWKFRVESLEVITDQSFEAIGKGGRHAGSSAGDSLAESLGWDFGF